MVAFNFKAEFAPAILDGTKRSTIRQKKRCEIGQNMQLYTGMRTKQCRKLFDATCIGTALITILPDARTPWTIAEQQGVVRFGAKSLHELEGFENVDSMLDFFMKHYSCPFTGWMHVWEMA